MSLQRRLAFESLENRFALAVIVVNTIVDEIDGNIADGDISLRDAIGAAAPGDSVEFELALDGRTIRLRSGEFRVTRPITIDASHLPAGLTIDASSLDPTPNDHSGDGSRVFFIDTRSSAPDAMTTLVGLTIKGGDVAGDGGAIFTRSRLTVSASTIFDNSARSGGGIYSDDWITIESTTIRNNLSRNGDGGGVYSMAATVANTTIAANIAAANVSGRGRGGGVYAVETVVATNSTFSGNSGAQGGGVRGKVTTLTNCTVTENWVLEGDVNQGGGISANFLNLISSIVAGNRGRSPELFALNYNLRYSLIGNNAGTTLVEAQNPDAAGNLVGGPQLGAINPLLLPLADNGGPTHTHPLRFGSDAIDAGDPITEIAYGTDQRGFPHIRTAGNRIDMGAYEWEFDHRNQSLVWEDNNRDGLQDYGEPVVRNVEVQLLDEAGQVINVTRTDDSGSYNFERLLANRQYRVRVVPPAGTFLSNSDQGANDLIDSDVDIVTGLSDAFLGGSDFLIDVGLHGSLDRASIGDNVWRDVNGDGIRSGGEVGVAGVMIKLLNGYQSEIRRAITDQLGNYRFTGLERGYYWLEVDVPATASLVAWNRGTNDRADSDIHRVTRRSELIFLIEGQNDLSRDAGLFYGETYGDTAVGLRVTEIQSEQYAYDFVELANVSDLPLNLRDVYFSAGIQFHFSTSRYETLFPGEHMVVTDNEEAFLQAHNDPTILVAGEFWESLNDAGETIALNMSGNHFQFEYDPGWFPLTDILAFSLTVRDEHAPLGEWGKRSNWRLSYSQQGSPGYADPALLPFQGAVVINEVMANPADGYNDWIELHNTTDEVIDISHWYLADDEEGDLRIASYRIPAGTTIPPNGFYVMTRAEHFGFGISSYGESIQLTAGDEQGRILGYSEIAVVKGSFTNTTYGWYRGEFVPLDYPTMNMPNAGRKLGPLVINEIMYKPGYLGDEFLEIVNISDQPVTVNSISVDSLGSWSNGITVPARGFLLIVAMDRGQFKAKYSIPEDVAILQTNGLTLDDGGAMLRLLIGEVEGRSMEIDQVRYDDSLPWPLAADEGGGSLERIYATQFGSDPSNWQVTSVFRGTPGSHNSQSLNRGDFNNDHQISVDDLDVLTSFIRTQLNATIFDVNNDGLIDLHDHDDWVTDILGTYMGDADVSFRVDGSDFNIWSSNQGQNITSWRSGDFNADGLINEQDYHIWQANKFQVAAQSLPTFSARTPRQTLREVTAIPIVHRAQISNIHFAHDQVQRNRPIGTPWWNSDLSNAETMRHKSYRRNMSYRSIQPYVAASNYATVDYLFATSPWSAMITSTCAANAVSFDRDLPYPLT